MKSLRCCTSDVSSHDMARASEPPPDAVSPMCPECLLPVATLHSLRVSPMHPGRTNIAAGRMSENSNEVGEFK